MGKVKGNKNGLVSTNQWGKKTENLLTVEELKKSYLFGVHVRDSDSGEELPDEAYERFLNDAISYLEHFLDMSITPVKGFVEYQDYRRNDYQEWGYMQLQNYPVHCVTSLKLVYFRDEDNTPIAVQTIPNSWLRLNNHDGIIRLVPNNRVASSLQISHGGSFFPELLQASNLPHAWEITYDYGFCTGQVPVLINTAIGMLAAIMTFIPAGHLILGAGIAGSSISLDGLSQSIQTTQSAENSGFSATLKDYSHKLFGETKDDPFAILKILKQYYKGPDLHIL